MSTNRSIDSRFWTDGWVRKLNALDRYVFLYLLTNDHSTWCGVYELPIDMAAHETGIKEKDLEDAILPRLSPKIIYVDGWVYVPNWVKYHMSASGNLSPQQKKGMDESFGKVPEKIRLKIKKLSPDGIPYVYPIGGVSASTSTSTSTSTSILENSAKAENSVKKSGPNATPTFEQWLEDQGFSQNPGPETPEGYSPLVWCDPDGVRLAQKRLKALEMEHRRINPRPTKIASFLVQDTALLVSLISDELKAQYGSSPIFGTAERAIISSLIKRTSLGFVKKYGKWFFRSEKIEKKYKFGVKAFASNDFINRFIAETGISPKE